MTKTKRRIYIATAIVLVCAAYGVCYLALPRHILRTGAYIAHVRIFQRDFQPYFFAPAGWIESLIIRGKPTPFGLDSACGQIVILQTIFDRTGAIHVELKFRARPDPTLYHTIGYDKDILEFAAEQASLYRIADRDEPVVVCRYLEPELCDAEDSLRAQFPRPYTLSKALVWYEEACDPQTRKHLLWLLGASRDPRAAILLAAALRSDELDVRSAAVYSFHSYFLPKMCSTGGDDESTFFDVYNWLELHGNELWRAED